MVTEGGEQLMIILGLDLALSTGYAVLTDGQLSTYGVIIHKVDNWVANINKHTDYPAIFPQNLITVARAIAADVAVKVAEANPDLIVVEDTSRGRNRTVQKLLEFIHFAVFDELRKHPAKTVILTNKCWRNAVGANANADEKALNSKIGRLKRKRRDEIQTRTDLTDEQRENIIKSGVKVDGKVTGRKKTKHFSIRVVEEQFGIKLMQKEDDVSDAILLGLAAYRLFGDKCPV